MIEVVVAIIPETKNIYYLSPNSLELKINDKIIFDSESGLMNGVIIKEKYMEKCQIFRYFQIYYINLSYRLISPLKLLYLYYILCSISLY